MKFRSGGFLTGDTVKILIFFIRIFLFLLFLIRVLLTLIKIHNFFSLGFVNPDFFPQFF